MKKVLFGILVHVFVNTLVRYLASIMNDSVIMCDEVMKKKQFEQVLTKKRATCKTQNLFILLAFSLITTTLLIAVSIYCYLIKYQAKQKNLLPFHNTNNELKQKHLLTFHDTKNELKQVLY